MDYARFVRLRRPLWEKLEARLAGLAARQKQMTHADLEETALLYRQVLHDHALSAARYPGTAAAERLRGLAIDGTHLLVSGRTERAGGIAQFFSRTFPEAFRRQLDLTGIALALFLLAAVWGLAVTAVQPGLGAAFLGPEAVAGLAEGKMWTDSLVSTVPPALSSSRIATNNISVALSAWSGGILAGVVPLYVALLNGLLLGSILGLTSHYSMAGELLEFISAHGPLEISLILVCCGAGLGIGRAVVVSGDLPRSLALRAAARDALTVLLGCVPWFVVLALVEVLVSPSPDLPAPFKLAVGISLEALFLAVAILPGRPQERP
jgi:uncharacterized membrane protein SpoIIM required for sporulation